MFSIFLVFTDVKLRFCDVSSAGSCCNAAMEQKMATYSRQVMEKNTRDVISKMSSTLQTRAQKFNGKFQEFASNLKFFTNMFLDTVRRWFFAFFKNSTKTEFIIFPINFTNISLEYLQFREHHFYLYSHTIKLIFI